MRSYLNLLLLLFFTATIASCAPVAQEHEEEPTTTEADVEAISKLLGDYESALNAGNLDSVMALYADDAVFMPVNAPAQLGEEAIRVFYQTNIFEQTTLNLAFTAVETEVLGEWAFARTDITGTAGGKLSIEPDQVDNKTLFILQQDNDGSWKIARYIFNSNNPPPEQ